MRDIVSTIAQPALVTRGEIVVAVNEPWLRARGFRREDVEGHSLAERLRPEERERLLDLIHLPDERTSSATPLPTVATNADGTVVPVRAYTSRLPSAEGPDYHLTIVLPDAAPGLSASFGGEAFSLSAELMGAEIGGRGARPDDARVRARRPPRALLA